MLKIHPADSKKICNMFLYFFYRTLTPYRNIALMPPLKLILMSQLGIRNDTHFSGDSSHNGEY
jgi:hypothetical protein